MKSFVCFIYIIVAISLATASTVGSSSSSSSSLSSSSDTKQDVESDLKPQLTSQLSNDYNRFRKSAGYGGSAGGYGAASIPAPPCPKNYLFSCQPNLAPVPCAAPAPAYGSAGGYSAPVPTYIAPLGNNYGLPQGYNGFVPQTFNQFYQY
ncbi:Vitelline membrane protein Vm26Aa [Lucilia cuprina]|uniref:Vitelline membrane protein Vm26Aa n=1 Tax=Lucilia cuprina TaxID=7375 RepID=A0A0L0C5Y0_LUCCU|nr:vitelline membrane protein Vm26Aa-like [Lucilia cuprina]KAI8115132.1 Vitelline membrane protein Vm26Aa [Lucilia cuprina]KNC27690.1 Vitelline membrane protein Vm26Aa [Lucilia cuprina]